MREHLCKIPPRMRMPTPPTSVVIEEIIKSPVDSRVLAPKKGQTTPAVEGLTPLILSMLGPLSHLQDLSRRETLMSRLFEVLIL